MILKMNNKSKNFYNMMGNFFGSRIVQNATNDRIYDDNNKEWYIYVQNNAPVAFISVASNVIKNIYAVQNNYLIDLLNYVKNEMQIKDSIVTRIYCDVYNSCGLIIDDNNAYKNFVKIRSDING